VLYRVGLTSRQRWLSLFAASAGDEASGILRRRRYCTECTSLRQFTGYCKGCWRVPVATFSRHVRSRVRVQVPHTFASEVQQIRIVEGTCFPDDVGFFSGVALFFREGRSAALKLARVPGFSGATMAKKARRAIR